MLEALLPEARGAAERLRARILDNSRVAPLPVSALKGYLADRKVGATDRRRTDRRTSERGASDRRSESLDPGPKIQLLRPGRSGLSM
jgi:hypothetical protein